MRCLMSLTTNGRGSAWARTDGAANPRYINNRARTDGAIRVREASMSIPPARDGVPPKRTKGGQTTATMGPALAHRLSAGLCPRTYYQGQHKATGAASPIVFPPTGPLHCKRSCPGRASLAKLNILHIKQGPHRSGGSREDQFHVRHHRLHWRPSSTAPSPGRAASPGISRL